MFLQIITQSLFYFLLIALVHYLYEYFKEMLTIPKVKDYIHIPKNEYNQIYKILNNDKKREIGGSKKNNKEELKNYFKNIHNNSKQGNNNGGNTNNMTQNLPTNKNEITYPSEIKSNGPISQSFSKQPSNNFGENIQSFNISQEFNDSLAFSNY